MSEHLHSFILGNLEKAFVAVACRIKTWFISGNGKNQLIILHGRCFVEKKFRRLRGIAGFYQFLSVLIVIAGILIGLLAIWSTTMDYDLATNTFNSAPPQFGVGLGIIALSIFMALGVFVFSELIVVFLAIEENTRLTSIAVSRLAKARREETN